MEGSKEILEGRVTLGDLKKLALTLAQRNQELRDLSHGPSAPAASKKSEPSHTAGALDKVVPGGWFKGDY